MSLATQVSNLATRIGTEFKTLRATLGANASLTTTDKTTLVNAINEVKAGISGAGATINDVTPSTTNVYSSSKTDAQIAAAKADLINSAPGTLDTLDELAAALGDDANFAASTATALGNRVRVDSVQTFTTGEKTQARANIGAGTSNLALGTTSTTAAAGDDSRLSDARTPTTHTHTASQISNATATGLSLVTAADAAAARTAIGAGTSNLAIGTTGTTAAAGNDTRLTDARTPTAHTHVATDISNSTAIGRSVLTAADATAVRTAIGAGTSSLVIGTTSGTAADAALVGSTVTDFVASFEAALV